MQLGEKIREQRKKHGLSQEKVAEFIGVSRQAVTKWEMNQSIPSTENLLKIAEIFGITVDMLISKEEEENSSADLCKTENIRKTDRLCMKWKKNVLFTLVVLGGYIAIYLAGRIFGTTSGVTSVTGWLFGTDPQQLSYLYGWLLHQNIFWIAAAVSIITALLGKKYFSFTSLWGFGIGLLLGELLGANPSGAIYGQGHYGWAIWGGIFLFSLVMGIILERFAAQGLILKSRKLLIWSIVFVAGIFFVVLLVWCSIPDAYGA